MPRPYACSTEGLVHCQCAFVTDVAYGLSADLAAISVLRSVGSQNRWTMRISVAIAGRMQQSYSRWWGRARNGESARKRRRSPGGRERADHPSRTPRATSSPTEHRPRRDLRTRTQRRPTHLGRPRDRQEPRRGDHRTQGVPGRGRHANFRLEGRPCALGTPTVTTPGLRVHRRRTDGAATEYFAFSPEVLLSVPPISVQAASVQVRVSVRVRLS
jgi:hypothetical protein